MRAVATALLCMLLMAAIASSADWRDEFEQLCSQVQGADSLSVEELQALIERTDMLLPLIDASDDPKKKVYMFRLQKCRQFFEYAIQVKR